MPSADAYRNLRQTVTSLITRKRFGIADQMILPHVGSQNASLLLFRKCIGLFLRLERFQFVASKKLPPYFAYTEEFICVGPGLMPRPQPGLAPPILRICLQAMRFRPVSAGGWVFLPLASRRALKRGSSAERSSYVRGSHRALSQSSAWLEREVLHLQRVGSPWAQYLQFHEHYKSKPGANLFLAIPKY
jgi:hypothetical protein